MSGLPDLALLAFFPLVMFLFTRMPPHRAVIAAVVGGMLFLPVMRMAQVMPGSPTPIVIGSLFALSKTNTIVVACLLSVLIFDSQRILDFRPRWYDVPMMYWCIASVVSNLTNGILLNNVYGQGRDHFLQWSIYYFLGRLYLGNLAAIKDLAIGLLVGAMAYVPFFLYEVLRGPHMHLRIYGFFQHQPGQAVRFGLNRPMVFMDHGLAVAIFMVPAAVLAFWLWHTKALTSLPWRKGMMPIPMLWVVATLLVCSVLTVSSGSILLGLTAAGVLLATRRMGFALLLVGLLAVPPLYVGLRTSGAWTGDNLVEWIETNFHQDRAASLKFRFLNENKLVVKVVQQPVLGWGDTGEAQKLKEHQTESEKPVTDGQWIITIGNHGVLGLTMMYLSMVLPSIRFAFKYKGRQWADPQIAPAAVLMVILPLWMIDCLLNAMYIPVWVLAAGALAGFVDAPIPSRRQTRGQPASVPTKPIPVETTAEPEPTDGAVPEPANEGASEPEPESAPAATPEESPAAPPGVLVRRRPWSK
jgi:hypothetical protein